MTTVATPDGVLLVDKPAGVTSHDVVLAARRATGEKRIGHTGTLDPFATGLLVLLVGRATRLLPYVESDPKVYDADIAFGAETDTEDLDGAVTRAADRPSKTAVLAAVAGLTGDLMQLPSSYSAKRVGGRRAYAIARRGGDPGLVPVPVRIDEWEPREWRGAEDAIERLVVRITCGGGTYVRALARDLGRAAGSAAHVTALRRVRSGAFDVREAQQLGDLSPGPGTLRPPLAAVAHLPRVLITHTEVASIARGISIPAAQPGGRAALVAEGAGVLVAIAEWRAGQWLPRVVMRRADGVDAPEPDAPEPAAM